MNNQIDNTILNWEVFELGDHSIVFSKPALMDASIVQEIQAFHNWIIEKNIPFIVDSIPAYHTLSLVYNILTAPKNIKQWGVELLHTFQKNNALNPFSLVEKEIIKVPVCYDEQFGIDLGLIASEKNISVETIIQLHTTETYLVYCLGFLPGFAYMGKLPEQIQVARHENPRPKIMEGSVGIAGAQTGIYPKDAPGGWKIIGRTPLRLFDPVHLATFKMGDRIQFYAISLAEFEAMQKENI